jgi:Holliday junction DNA helicase RuvA
MIASITGKIRRKHADYVIVDVSGVGYQIHVPLSTSGRMPDHGEEVSLHVHTHLREDSLSLFGFFSEEEKEAFLLLMGVSGIGPKLALAILSALSVGDLVAAIGSADDARLCSIPGIGKKTAARMVLELKDRMNDLVHVAAPHLRPSPSAASRHLEDAVSALVNLGYKKPLAEDAVRRVHEERPGVRLEELIRESLGELMKR